MVTWSLLYRFNSTEDMEKLVAFLALIVASLATG